MKKIFIIIVAVLGLGGAYWLYSSKSSAPAVTTFSGPWKDGTFTGQTFTNNYGPVQVAAVVSGGKITTVTFLQLPSDRAHSQEVSAMAKPALLQETITAQNANVATVSGATQTTESYTQSLQSALNQAM